MRFDTLDHLYALDEKKLGLLLVSAALLSHAATTDNRAYRGTYVTSNLLRTMHQAAPAQTAHLFKCNDLCCKMSFIIRLLSAREQSKRERRLARSSYLLCLLRATHQLLETIAVILIKHMQCFAGARMCKPTHAAFRSALMPSRVIPRQSLQHLALRRQLLPASTAKLQRASLESPLLTDPYSLQQISSFASDLPVHDILGQLSEAVCGLPSLVLQAPPGAGKTTIVPLLVAACLPDKLVLVGVDETRRAPSLRLRTANKSQGMPAGDRAPASGSKSGSATYGRIDADFYRKAGWLSSPARERHEPDYESRCYDTWSSTETNARGMPPAPYRQVQQRILAKQSPPD